MSTGSRHHDFLVVSANHSLGDRRKHHRYRAGRLEGQVRVVSVYVYAIASALGLSLVSLRGGMYTVYVHLCFVYFRLFEINLNITNWKTHIITWINA